jgi:hypothetical protein
MDTYTRPPWYTGIIPLQTEYTYTWGHHFYQQQSRTILVMHQSVVEQFWYIFRCALKLD